jgi:hypothetical protein
LRSASAGPAPPKLSQVLKDRRPEQQGGDKRDRQSPVLPKLQETSCEHLMLRPPG